MESSCLTYLECQFPKVWKDLAAGGQRQMHKNLNAFSAAEPCA